MHIAWRWCKYRNIEIILEKGTFWLISFYCEVNNKNVTIIEQLTTIIDLLDEDFDSIFSFSREKSDQIEWD